MIQILFKFRVEQHPKPVLLFIKGQLIWAAHVRVITFRVLHYLQKTWKNSTKICKFCNIIEEARWYKFCLNLKYSNILSQCCYLSKRNSFEPLIAELSPFESYTIYKKREKLHKICKFCNIIEEARWYKFCLNLKYSNILSQCCYLSKGNLFEPLMAELSPFESYTIYKKR